jgi:hypothetical protein
MGHVHLDIAQLEGDMQATPFVAACIVFVNITYTLYRLLAFQTSLLPEKLQNPILYTLSSPFIHPLSDGQIVSFSFVQLGHIGLAGSHHRAGNCSSHHGLRVHVTTAIRS